MRHLLITAAAIAFTSSAFAAPAPDFRPLDSNMIVSQPAPAGAAPAQAAAPTPTYPRARDGEIIDSIGEGAIPALPLEVEKSNGITYLSGGIGDEELAQLKAQEETYNLRLQISGPYGAYLSDVWMTLSADGKTLVSMNDAGPYVYMLVPAGKYQIDLTGPSGTKQSFSIDVPANKAVKKSIRL